jgi:hypothetical protein
MKKIDAWQAADGSLHETAAAARTHERSIAPKLLVGMSEAEIDAALERRNPELADAIETVGAMIAAKRREDGDLRGKGGRPRKSDGAPEAEPQPAEEFFDSEASPPQ